MIGRYGDGRSGHSLLYKGIGPGTGRSVKGRIQDTPDV
jgi:hypothetical protein